MKKIIFCVFLLPLFCKSQSASYEDSLSKFIGNYVQVHEVVKGEDKKLMQFYPINKAYRVVASFEKKENSEWFLMYTSANTQQQYRVYGVLSFKLNDTLLKLHLYQSKDLLSSKEYWNYLFLPFTDKTTGIDTYGGGRYIDLVMADIHGNNCVIDFNKAYNPYCAYAAGYHCPIPPAENDMPVAVIAGEKNYLKANYIQHE